MLTTKTTKNFKLADSYLRLNNNKSNDINIMDSLPSSDSVNTDGSRRNSLGPKSHKHPLMFLTTSVVPPIVAAANNESPSENLNYKAYRSSSTPNMAITKPQKSSSNAEYTNFPSAQKRRTAVTTALNSLLNSEQVSVHHVPRLSILDDSTRNASSSSPTQLPNINLSQRQRSPIKLISTAQQPLGASILMDDSHFPSYLDFLQQNSDTDSLNDFKRRLERGEKKKESGQISSQVREMLENVKKLSVDRRGSKVQRVFVSHPESISSTDTPTTNGLNRVSLFGRAPPIRKDQKKGTLMCYDTFMDANDHNNSGILDHHHSHSAFQPRNSGGTTPASPTHNKSFAQHIKFNMASRANQLGSDNTSNADKSMQDTRNQFYNHKKSPLNIVERQHQRRSTRGLTISSLHKQTSETGYEKARHLDEKLIREVTYNLNVLVSMNKNEKTTSGVINRIAKEDRHLLALVHAKYHRIQDYDVERLKRKLSAVRVTQDIVPPIDWKSNVILIDPNTLRKLKFFAEGLDEYNIDKKTESIKGLEEFLIKSHLNTKESQKQLLRKLGNQSQKSYDVVQEISQLHGAVDFEYLGVKDTLKLIEECESTQGEIREILPRNRSLALNLRDLVQNYLKCSKEHSLSNRFIG